MPDFKMGPVFSRAAACTPLRGRRGGLGGDEDSLFDPLPSPLLLQRFQGWRAKKEDWEGAVGVLVFSARASVSELLGGEQYHLYHFRVRHGGALVQWVASPWLAHLVPAKVWSQSTGTDEQVVSESYWGHLSITGQW